MKWHVPISHMEFAFFLKLQHSQMFLVQKVRLILWTWIWLVFHFFLSPWKTLWRCEVWQLTPVPTEEHRWRPSHRNPFEARKKWRANENKLKRSTQEDWTGWFRLYRNQKCNRRNFIAEWRLMFDISHCGRLLIYFILSFDMQSTF